MYDSKYAKTGPLAMFFPVQPLNSGVCGARFNAVEFTKMVARPGPKAVDKSKVGS
jgi:hypothetical protein